MTAGHQHGGKRRLGGGGDIQISRHMVIRMTLEEDVFDPITVAFDPTRHLSIQRRLHRQRPEQLEVIASQLFLSGRQRLW